MLGQASLPNGLVPNGQSSHHLQVEIDQAVSTRDVGSEKKARLLMMCFGFGCFALGVASACLVLPSASHAGSHHFRAVADVAFSPRTVITLRGNPATAPLKAPSKFRPKVSHTSIVPAMNNRNSWPRESDDHLSLSRVSVLLYNPRTEHEGIYCLQKQIREEDGKVHNVNTIVLFEKQEDAERYAGFLEAQDFPMPQVESLDLREVAAFALKEGYTTSLIPAGQLFLPPQDNVPSEERDWQPDGSKPLWQVLADSEDHDSVDYTNERARLEALFGSA